MLSEKINREKRMLLYGIILLCCLCCGGCSKQSTIEIQTVVSINEDGSGSREIILKWDEDAYQEYFSQSLQDLNGLMDASCPDSMKWTYEDNNGIAEYIFKIDFSSKSDYQEKVKSILNRDVQINLEQAGNAFTSGLKLQEDFTSVDLLNWLKLLLVERQYTTQSDIDRLLVNGSYEVDYQDQKYTGEDAMINVDQIVSSPVKQMDILTTFQNGNQYSRKILLEFDKTNVSSHKEAIASYLASKLPDGVETSWEEYENAVFVLELKNVSWNVQNEFMKNLMGGSDSYIFVSDTKTKGIFSFKNKWSEYLDVSALLIEGQESIPVGYYIQAEDGISLSAEMSNNGKYALKESNLYGGYQQVFQKDLQKEEVICIANRVYVVSDIEVEIDFKKKSDVSQKILFWLAYTPQEEEKNTIVEKIVNRADEQVEVSTQSDKENRFCICVQQSGKMREVSQVMKDLYGDNNNMNYEIEEMSWQWMRSASFVQRLDFSEFVENDEKLTTLTYHLSFPFGEDIQEESISSTVNLKNGTQEISGNDYTGSLSGLCLSVTLKTKQVNSFLAWLVGIIVIVVLIVVGVLVFAGRLKKIIRRVSGGVSDFNQSFLSEEEDED
jgi:hypothetical protein